MTVIMAAAVAATGCTWKFDTTWHEGDGFTVEPFHTDGAIRGGVLSPAPSAGITVKSGEPSATYSATWSVPGDIPRTESGLVADTPRPFEGIPATAGVHVLQGEVWDDARPDRTVSYTIEYTVDTENTSGIDGVWSVYPGTLKYNDYGVLVPDVEPEASVTLTVGDPSAVYDLRWTVAPDYGGSYREAEDVKIDVPFFFPDLPTGLGTHIVSGRITERGNPDRYWPFEFQYTITGPSQKDLVFEPYAQSGSYELPDTEPVLRTHASAGLRAIAGDAAFDVAYSVDGADSVYVRGVPGGDTPVPFDLAGHEGLGAHRVRGTVRELSGNREAKPFDVSYDMGCRMVDGDGTPALVFSDGQLSLDLRTNDGQFVRQDQRKYDFYSAPAVRVLRTPAAGGTMVAVCRDAAGTVRRLGDGGLFKAVHDDADPFRDLGVKAVVYELSSDGVIISCEDAGTVGCRYVSRQIIFDGEGVEGTRPRLAGVARGAAPNGSFVSIAPQETGAYVLSNLDYLQMDVQFFVTEESNTKSPFVILDIEGVEADGISYVFQSDSHQVISTFQSLMGQTLYSTVSYYRVKVPSGLSSGTVRLSLSDGVSVYVIDVPWKR